MQYTVTAALLAAILTGINWRLYRKTLGIAVWVDAKDAEED